MDVNIFDRNEERERIRARIRNSNNQDMDLIEILAAKAGSLDAVRRVCVYCRVPMDDLGQVTSCELLKKHYAERISNTPGWSFAGFYMDEGIDTTFLKNRDEFDQMIDDCCEGKIDIIVTKNVSRFAGNVKDCIRIVRQLSQLDPPVGVVFEMERIFSLDSGGETTLTALAAADQERSNIRD